MRGRALDLGLRDQVALVSGATRGIGRAIAGALIAEGARVVVTGRSAVDLASTQAALAAVAGPDRVRAFQADMTEPASVVGVACSVTEAWGRVDIGVANVGSGTGRLLLEATPDDWRKGLQTNLLGAVELARALVPAMQARGEGVLLFISSIVGVEATPAPLPYVAAKSALNAVAKSMARQLGAHGLRVNVLSPGNVLFADGSWARKLADAPDRVQAYIEGEVPMRRFGTPEEIADVAIFMCSRRASFMKGACVVVDGGQTRAF